MLDINNVIYKATSLLTGKHYIGLTTETLRERRTKHLSSARNMSNTHFHKAIRKYGEDNFKWEVIEEFSDIVDKENAMEILSEKEKYWIKYYDSFKNGYNSTEGGEGVVGIKHTLEARQKMRKAKLGRVLPKEQRSKISKSVMENHPFRGKTGKDAPVSKPVVQLSIKGEFINRYDTITEGAMSVDGDVGGICRCLATDNVTAFGYRWLYEWDYERYINGELELPKKRDPKEYTAKAVIQLTRDGEYVAEYMSAKEFARSIGKEKSATHINACCTGKRGSAFGFKWMYKEEYEKSLATA